MFLNILFFKLRKRKYIEKNGSIKNADVVMSEVKNKRWKN